MILEENILLNNGIKMPRYGFGTWFIERKDTMVAVQNAIDLGYRRIDVDADFPNLTEIGKALAGTSKQVFVGVKLPTKVSENNVESIIDNLLAALRLGSVDMLLLRKGQTWSVTRSTWQVLVRLAKTDKVSALGVVDFKKEEIQRLGQESLAYPMVNQAVVRIGQTPADLLRYDDVNDIVTEAYSPVPHGLALKAPVVAEIADKYGVSITRLCLRYDWQLGLAMWRQTTNTAHMKENADIDFEISDQDMQTLKRLQVVE